MQIIEPERRNLADTFSRDHAPIATIESGESIRVRTLNSAGHLQRMTEPGVVPEVALSSRRGHCLVGPIEVRGAKAGQMLAIRFDALQPDDWGFTATGGRTSALNDALQVADGDPTWLLWSIDGDAAITQQGLTAPVAPFFGVVGVAPVDPGEHSTIAPRAGSGGNIDCRDLTAGSTLYLPVAVDGAMVYVGDGHAAQGGGEVGGTAIETGMTSELTIELIDDGPVDTVHAITPTHRITFGFDADLNAATAEALDAMLGWMQQLHGVDRRTALAYASTTVDLHVTQVANITWGVHAMLAKRNR